MNENENENENDDKIRVIMGGEGMFSRERIEINKEITESITMMHIRIYAKKLYKKILSNNNCEFYIYIILPDFSCGFIPTNEQKICDLVKLFGANNILSLKISDKIYFG